MRSSMETCTQAASWWVRPVCRACAVYHCVVLAHCDCVHYTVLWVLQRVYCGHAPSVMHHGADLGIAGSVAFCCTPVNRLAAVGWGACKHGVGQQCQDHAQLGAAGAALCCYCSQPMLEPGCAGMSLALVCHTHPAFPSLAALPGDC
jgi:hypothetical protein